MLINMVLPGAVETARLPKEYQEVEYIQSSGTQYIDTGFVPNQDSSIELDFQALNVGGVNVFIAGQRNTTTSNVLVVLINTSDDFRFGYNDKASNAGSADTERHTIKTDKNVFYLDGTVTRTLTYAAFEGVGNIYLFAINQQNSPYGYGSLKLYSCRLYDNGVLVRDYVPCYRKSDTAIGLYDLVNGVFYANAGTGVFTKGADVSGTITPPATGDFTFTYSGNYTDNRVNGIGDVTLNTSGTLTVLSGKATVSVYILGAGGGGYYNDPYTAWASGGGGGNQTIEVELTPGTYDIVIGTGGAGKVDLGTASGEYAGNGGSTTAFGFTSTGGTGGGIDAFYDGEAGTGGIPNGADGAAGTTKLVAGGSPNGGSAGFEVANNGGDGYVELTFI